MNSPVRKAMIRAAGEGTRLRPLTLQIPKVLVPIAGRPVIEHSIGWLKRHGIAEIAINLHYLGGQISAHLGDGTRYGVHIRYSPETTLLGTAGGVKQMQDFFDGAFVVVYGDNLTDFDLSAMVAFHREKKAVATLAVFESPHPRAVGMIDMGEDGKILRLQEKPGPSVHIPQATVPANAGVYVLERECLDLVPPGVFCDFARDVFPEMLLRGMPVYGYRLEPEAFFIDIGTPENYARANEYYLHSPPYRP